MKGKKSLTFIDLFAGVGGFRMGMERAGHKCAGFCEIDKHARQSYKAIFDTREEVEMHDITKLSDDFIQRIGRVDVITGGFPCQAFSLAGKRRGFSDTRGTLFLKLHASQRFCNLAIYSLKTSKDSSITKEGLRLRRSSERWMNWGMTFRGKCLTAKILSHKTENVSLLSDILEDKVPDSFYLSQEKKNQLIKNQQKST